MTDAKAPKKTAGDKPVQPKEAEEASTTMTAGTNIGEVNWEAVLGQLTQKKNRFVMPGEGRTRIRAVLAPGSDPRAFFHETNRYWRGTARKRYIFYGVVIDEGSDRNQVVPVVVPKNVITQIISLLVEGYDIFDPVTGHGLTIMRSGKSTDTEYNVTASPKPVKLDPKGLQWPSESLAEMAAAFEKSSLERDQKNTTEGLADKLEGAQKGEASLGEAGEW